MTAIGPGDWVECVDADFGVGVWADRRRIFKGMLYQVSDAWIDFDNEPVILVGWEREVATREFGARAGYWVRRFRPIYRPKADLIESLKTPAKREHQPA